MDFKHIEKPQPDALLAVIACSLSGQKRKSSFCLPTILFAKSATRRCPALSIFMPRIANAAQRSNRFRRNIAADC